MTTAPDMLPRFSTDLSGEVALVTGTTSGIGARFAEVLAACGAAVALTGRRTERLAPLAERIRARGGRSASYALDVTDADSIVSVIDAVGADLGPISILVNNAGIGIGAPALSASLEDLDAMLATNVRGPFIAAREVARRMIEAGIEGRIVNVASITAVMTVPGIAGYATTKAALAQMTRVMAREWARHGINVNALLPGYLLTEINAEHFASPAGEKQLGRFPRRRLGEPADLDGALLLLVSPASRFITGTLLTLDDGQSLG
ncbi:MAG: SDR family oxidoreductase [Alphaproteobacteria bacterium]|nr:SDR family oxidoreductase [Alphaproteobacteria bacterium]